MHLAIFYVLQFFSSSKFLIFVLRPFNTGAINYPNHTVQSWASLLGSLPVLSAQFFASNKCDIEQI